MAIEIGNKQYSDYSEEKLATQGNVVNTLSAYNEQVKENYNDRIEDKSHNDTLQSSIETIVKSLDKSNTVTKTFEDKVSVVSLDTDTSKLFGESGLIRKLDLISKAISPKGINKDNWDSSIHANNIAGEKKETISNVPVCALTKGQDYEYKSNELFDGNFGINGIESNSQYFVLSEKQISDMVLTASRSIISDYTLKINQLKELLKQSTARSMAAINYLSNLKKPAVKGYFPIDILYNAQNNFYIFTTLNGTKVNVSANDFYENDGTLYFNLNDTTISTENTSQSSSYCKVILKNGKVSVYQEPAELGDTGYELYLLSYRVIVIIDSDIDLSEYNYKVKFNNQDIPLTDKIFISPTNQFRYQKELPITEGSNNTVILPYIDIFKEIEVFVNENKIESDKEFNLNNVSTDVTIKMVINDNNTRDIIYYSGYSE